LVCPGSTAAAKAECLFQAGQLDQAREQFSALRGGPSRGFAALRLGDIALALDDPEQALAEYQEASKPSSPVAALAALRRCELIDDCLPITLDPRGYPEAERPEARLRIARQLAFHGKWSEVVDLLAEISKGKVDEAHRVETLRLQRRLLIGALAVPAAGATDDASAGQSNADDDRLTQALELYLSDPDRLTGHYAEQLTDAAAEAAAHLGTPRFGAHILAAVFPEVASKHRAGHLLRTAELYLDDEDAAHAEAILEFARTRVPAAELRAPRWRRAARRLQQYGDHVRADQALTARLRKDVELTREVTEAVRVSSAARAKPEGTP
jgi:tetratricopeptide (TPR) repeat protein